jgi:hypothetical protein
MAVRCRLGVRGVSSGRFSSTGGGGPGLVRSVGRRGEHLGAIGVGVGLAGRRGRARGVAGSGPGGAGGVAARGGCWPPGGAC